METDLIQEIEQFITTVHQMREAQRRYFRTRTKGALAESIHLEKQVDSWLQKQLDCEILQAEIIE